MIFKNYNTSFYFTVKLRILFANQSNRIHLSEQEYQPIILQQHSRLLMLQI